MGYAAFIHRTRGWRYTLSVAPKIYANARVLGCLSKHLPDLI